jgi:hypothetical protein
MEDQIEIVLIVGYFHILHIRYQNAATKHAINTISSGVVRRIPASSWPVDEYFDDELSILQWALPRITVVKQCDIEEPKIT